MLTGNEERRIDEIYEKHAKWCIEWQKVLKPSLIKVVLYSFILSAVVIVIIVLGLTLMGELESAILLFPFGLASILVCGIIVYVYMGAKKEKEKLKDVWFSKKENEQESIMLHTSEKLKEFHYNINSFLDDYYKFIWGNCESTFTKLHLKYLAMKSKVDESEFKNFLHCPFTNIQLKPSDKDELIKIFSNVKERVENKKISDECKVDVTPWEIFKYYFYIAWVNCHFIYQEEIRGERVCIIQEKIYKIFQEFDEAPRISGDLVVELEDLLEDKEESEKGIVEYVGKMCGVPSVSKDEVLKLVEAWRKYKIEERLV